MTTTIKFSPLKSTKIHNPSEYKNGKIVGGFRVTTPISEVVPDIKDVFDVNKPARSTTANFEDIEEGMIVDISYRKSSNSVNTPYRVATMKKSRNYSDRFDVPQTDVKLLLEPLVQNASLVILSGHERVHVDNKVQVIEKIYYKSPWNEPTAPENFKEITYDSEYNRYGFNRKDKQFRNISLVFDEVIAEVIGRESELLPVIV